MTKNFFDDDEPLIPTAVNAARRSSAPFSNDGKFKKNILIILPLVIGVIIVTYFFFKMILAPKLHSTKHPGQTTSSPAPKDSVVSSYVNLEPMIINLLSASDKPHYLKLAVTLQCSVDQNPSEIEAKLPTILDSLQIFVRGLRVEDFSGSGSTLLFKEELLKRINKITYPLLVNDLLFKEMVIN